MFICMPKINFIIHFFLEMLHFKESCKLIGHKIWPITQEPEFCQTWHWWWNISNKISFHFRLLPRKTNNIFQTIQKDLFCSHSRPFLPKFGQKWIYLEKKSSDNFKYSNYLLSWKKLEKTNDNRSHAKLPEKNAKLTDRQTDKRWFYTTLPWTGVQ